MPNRPTGCPVEREASDSEKILKWLGYTQYRGQPLWVKSGNCAYTRVINFERERHFLPGEHPADPELDCLVIEHVRTLDGKTVEAFERRLNSLYVVRWAHREQPETPTTLELHVLFYLPGDYAEAARFLWEDA